MNTYKFYKSSIDRCSNELLTGIKQLKQAAVRAESI
jgi:hypothetical protein